MIPTTLSVKLDVNIHAEGGGYWAEVPALPGCVSEGDTMEEVLANIKESAEGYLLALAQKIVANADLRAGALGEHLVAISQEIVAREGWDG